MVNTEKQGHDAHWIALDLEGVMTLLQCNISGAISYNMSTNKNAWKFLKEEIPSQFFHGCISNGYHLLVKELCSATKTIHPSVSGNPTSYLSDYLFADLLAFFTVMQRGCYFFP